MKPTLFCLTPVKNEEWIIERFLLSASIWADKIIISDQGSTDKTIEIAKKFPKVTIINNSALQDFNEQNMRKPLFEEARKTAGKRILISLDADEIFTPNFDSPEWNTIIKAEEGTRFIFDIYNIQPDYKRVEYTIDSLHCGFVDDNSEYEVGLIHVPRQPSKEDAWHIKFNDISILHFQFTDWKRMECKHIWYQMYERINFPNKSVIKIFRAYHYDKEGYATHYGSKILPIDPKWIEGYKKRGLDITSVMIQPDYSWCSKILDYIQSYSLKYFRHIDLGNIIWSEIAIKYKREYDLKQFEYHYSIFDRWLLSYLRRTQRIRFKLYIKFIDYILIKIF
ncbi:MAG: glycosyltransferase family 2 protein [Bacteroidaceae bacterium]|nr:glycosyltransferase family 2 protein [Bacteroidaceae bacterium]